jgi:hypothetical protein
VKQNHFPFRILNKGVNFVKRFLAILPILFILIGCQNENVNKTTDQTLDTSNLTKEDTESEGSYQFSFDIYKAPSLEVALDAIPFDVNLPEELPFEAEPFKVMNIYDFDKDGKKIEIDFLTISKTGDDSSTNSFLFINASNYDMTAAIPEEVEEVVVGSDVQGEYNDSSLSFSVEGIYYKIMLDTSDNVNIKEELVNIAEQMI